MKRSLLTLFVLFALTAPAAAEKIKEIDVDENTKTTDETVKLIAGVEVGDTITEGMTDQIERDLVSSGLFKKVDVFTQPIAGGVRLVIVAQDKHSWVIAPAVYNQPTNKGGGIGFGENNLFGENKKLLLYAQGATGDSFFIGAYVDPSIAGTRFKWQYDVYLQRRRVFEYAPPDGWIDEDPLELRKSKLNYLNSGLTLGVNVFRTISLNVRLRGAYVYFSEVEPGADAPAGATYANPGGEGWDISSEAILQYDGIANWYGIASGDRYRVSYEHELPQLGSEFNDYFYATAQYVRARKYFSRHNLILKAVGGYGQRMPFHQEYTSGGTDLRGFKNFQFRGNLKLEANIEYSIPILTIKGVALRGLAFIDSAYTTFYRVDPSANPSRDYLPGYDRLGLAPFKNTVGLGTRLYIRQIVLPLLGLDFGYGIESNAIEMYFAIGLTAF